MISMGVFVGGFVVISSLARLGVEYYVNRTQESPQGRGNVQAGEFNYTASNAVERYYNTYRKGA